MGDRSFTSDWEVVSDGASTSNTNKSNDNDPTIENNVESSSTTAAVVVVLPPDFASDHDTTQGRTQEPNVGLSAPLLCNQQDGSTTSSFSMVRRFNHIHLDRADCPTSAASESSFASVSSSFVATATTTCDTSTSSRYDILNGVARNTPSTTSSEISSSSSSSVSLTSQFDILSISGKTVKRCRSCTFHNKPSATMCLVCSLALVANPNISMDTQLAMHLQEQEEEKLHAALLQTEENTRKRLAKEDFEDCVHCIAPVLAQDIRDFLMQSRSRPRSSGGLYTFAPMIMGYQTAKDERESLCFYSSLVRRFFDTSPRSSQCSFYVSFAYKLSSAKALRRIAKGGFVPRISRRVGGGVEAGGSVDVSLTLEDAVKAFFQEREEGGEEPPFTSADDSNALLYPILEDSTEQNDVSGDDDDIPVAWIVAIAREDKSSVVELPETDETKNKVVTTANTSAVRRNPIVVPCSPARVLPIAYFDAFSADRSDVKYLLEGLRGIFAPFSFCVPTTNLEADHNWSSMPEAAAVAPATKKTRLI